MLPAQLSLPLDLSQFFTLYSSTLGHAVTLRSSKLDDFQSISINMFVSELPLLSNSVLMTGVKVEGWTAKSLVLYRNLQAIRNILHYNDHQQSRIALTIQKLFEEQTFAASPAKKFLSHKVDPNLPCSLYVKPQTALSQRTAYIIPTNGSTPITPLKGGDKVVRLGIQVDAIQHTLKAVAIIKNRTAGDFSQKELKYVEWFSGSRGHLTLYDTFQIAKSQTPHSATRTYMVTDYYDWDLHRAIHSKALSEEQVLDVTIDISHALEAAHKCNIIHNDIKPSNIVLNLTGTRSAKGALVDWSRAFDASEESELPDHFYATPDYTAPDLLNNKSDIRIIGSETITEEKKYDIFSLGLTFVEALLGRINIEQDLIDIRNDNVDSDDEIDDISSSNNELFLIPDSVQEKAPIVAEEVLQVQEGEESDDTLQKNTLPEDPSPKNSTYNPLFDDEDSIHSNSQNEQEDDIEESVDLIDEIPLHSTLQERLRWFFENENVLSKLGYSSIMAEINALYEIIHIKVQQEAETILNQRPFSIKGRILSLCASMINPVSKNRPTILEVVKKLEQIKHEHTTISNVIHFASSQNRVHTTQQLN